MGQTVRLFALKFRTGTNNHLALNPLMNATEERREWNRLYYHIGILYIRLKWYILLITGAIIPKKEAMNKHRITKHLEFLNMRNLKIT